MDEHEQPRPERDREPRRRRVRRALAYTSVAALAGAGGMLLMSAAGAGRPVDGHASIAMGGGGAPGAGVYRFYEAGAATAATPAQETGVVDVNTIIDFGVGGAAGTGTVMSPDGGILTNNHVVEGATRITVTVPATGRSYAASVVGTDPGQDIAVLRAQGASGLAVARYGPSEPVSTGEAVTGVGNAGGTGVPSAASGTVTALDQRITATAEGGADSETLTGLIATDAPIQPGDSGGPLYDGAHAIVGMDTAAGHAPDGQTLAGYAIPIAHALHVAAQIESGTSTAAGIHRGYPGFLGIALAPTGGRGVGVEQVLAGTPASASGLVAGDVITAVNGAHVAGPTQLSSALAGRHPGDHVTIAWTGGGGTHHARVTLARGPAL